MKIIHMFMLTCVMFFIEASHAQSTIYKCVEKGKTVYSQSPCQAATNKQSTIEPKTDYMGNTTYDKETIDATRAKIQSEMKEQSSGGGAATTGEVLPIGATKARQATAAARKQTCESIADEKKQLEWMQWQRPYQSSQEWIKDRKERLNKDSYEWGC